jgi:hypothetical protein
VAPNAAFLCVLGEKECVYMGFRFLLALNGGLESKEKEGEK